MDGVGALYVYICLALTIAGIVLGRLTKKVQYEYFVYLNGKNLC